MIEAVSHFETLKKRNSRLYVKELLLIWNKENTHKFDLKLIHILQKYSHEKYEL